MPEPSTLVVFAGAALLLAIVPGPAVLYIVGQSVAHGRSDPIGAPHRPLARTFTTVSLWALVSGSAADWLRGRRRFAAIDRYGAGTIFVGLGVSSALAHPARH